MKTSGENEPGGNPVQEPLKRTQSKPHGDNERTSPKRRVSKRALREAALRRAPVLHPDWAPK